MNLEPFVKGISEFIGATGKVVEEGMAKGKGVKAGKTHVDIERYLGNLSVPEKQVPLIHDYLRGHSALAEAKATTATHVRDISVPVWETAQTVLQQKIDADPEAQTALKNLFIGMNTPIDKELSMSVIKEPPVEPRATSTEVPQTVTGQARVSTPKAKDESVMRKQQGDAWNEFAVAVESQDAPRIDAALERLKGLHDTEIVGLEPGETPAWQQAMNYMANLEQQAQAWRQVKLGNEGWADAIKTFREQSGIDDLKLSKPARETVQRFEAWVDAQKPATTEDLFTQALGVPRAVMSSADLSAPGRQGLLMMSRPEYWQSLEPMVKGWKEGGYRENQAYIRNHPDYHTAQEAGLALTDVHSKLAPREEAFQSKMAERIPILGKVVKSSEQAYTTFLNRLRFDVFTNTMKEAAAAGVDVSDKEFQRSLAEWVNTSTGRGGGKGFNPGVLSTVLFSPRLAISRFQTFNPMYYYKMNPFVRQQAIKANMAAAATIFGLVSLAGMGGARVTWDFRNPDAGKIRVGNTRIDIGGGHLQYLRLFTQIATRQKVNSETGKVTNLGEKFGAPSALDVVQNFIVAKEAPVASFVTDWLRGKDMAGDKFDTTAAIIARTVPLAMQDMYDVLQDQGFQGLLYAFPAALGVGIQTYTAKPGKETVPFIGVQGEVPPEQAAEYAKAIEEADKRAAVMTTLKTQGKGPAATKAVLRNFVRVERLKVRLAWIKANKDAFVTAKKAGEKSIVLTPPVEETQ